MAPFYVLFLFVSPVTWARRGRNAAGFRSGWFSSHVSLTHPRGGASSSGDDQNQVKDAAAFIVQSSAPTEEIQDELLPGDDELTNDADDEESTVANASSKQRPERGKVLPSPFDVKDFYKVYAELRDSYRQLIDSDEWKLLTRKHDVEVSILKHPSDPWCPFIKMKGIFPVSVEQCWDFLRVPNWPVSMPKMDPFYEGVEMHHQTKLDDITFILCRKRTKRILAFGKRDLVFLSVSDQPLDDGTWVSGTVSVVTQDIPRQAGYTRAFQDSVAFYKPLENNTKTEICITCRIDLNDSGEGGSGGFIPMFLYVKTIGRTGLQSIVRMREALLNDLKEHKARTSNDSMQK